MIKPCKFEDIKGGQFYLIVHCVRGKLWLGNVKFNGQPYKEYGYIFIYGYHVFNDGFVNRDNFSLKNTNDGSRHNQNSTFRYTEKNRRVLEDLVARQDIEGYLKIARITA